MPEFIESLDFFTRIIEGNDNKTQVFNNMGIASTPLSSVMDHKLVVIDFTAKWCGPCQKISPYFTRISEIYNKMTKFYKVDIDEAPDIAEFCQVSKLPTFKLYYKGKEVKSICGDIMELEKSIVNILQIIESKIKNLGNQQQIQTEDNDYSYGAPVNWTNDIPNQLRQVDTNQGC